MKRSILGVAMAASVAVALPMVANAATAQATLVQKINNAYGTRFKVPQPSKSVFAAQHQAAQHQAAPHHA
ncbi:hypothetical protein [Acidiphilium sp.]|uniref:hypothetical protein n=1 Tax=Acidiphilium sp. TaxID=527 RepID=UPI003D07D8C8